MSFQKMDLKSLALKQTPSSKNSLSNLWKHFMSSYGYQNYYNLSKDSSLIKNITNQKKELYNISNEALLDFFEENSISIIKDDDSFNYKLISNEKKGLNFLSEAKIWIMFIVYVVFENENKSNKILNTIVMNIFKEAINNGCDVISLFEFFLIYISHLNENDYKKYYNSKNITETIPKEFIILYFSKKNKLRNIFHKEIDEYNIINMRNSLKDFLGKDFVINSGSSILSSDKKSNNKNENMNKEKENIILDMKDIIIVSKDYLNKGYFVIFKNKQDFNKDNEDIIKNPFISYDFEEDDENYCLMPLLNKYKDYEQKLDANKTLNLINKSIFKNYTYYPHDINIIKNLL